MKYLKSWVEDYWKTEKSGDEIAKILSALGSETESVNLAPIVDENVVVARVLEVKPHPNADRLKIVKITEGESEIEVVCGAPNVAEGQCVAYARPGAKIASGKVEKANIRGVESPGMLLSERELGIGNDHTGIKVLDENISAGSPVLKHLQGEIIFEADITPNRGDLLSHFGLARDMSAYEFSSKVSQRRPAYGMGGQASGLEKPRVNVPEAHERADQEISVEIKTKNCPLYLARKVSGVKIGPSPDWLVKRLEAIGISSINNVVDVTNYIMLDLGHPLHAFDARKIAGDKIIVRDLEKNEEVVTLDGGARELIEGMMVIADEKLPIAVAGVMGLKNSEIDDSTLDVVIEAAVFDRKSIRKTAKLLGLVTEASYRFERGVDDASAEYALDKAAKMIREMAGGKILKGVVQAGKLSAISYQPIEYERISKLIGVEYSKEKIDQILELLGFKIKNGQAIIPSWRHDISSWQDLAEEVARIDGIVKIKPEKLSGAKTEIEESDWHKKEAVKDFLVSLGLNEALNYTFLSEEDVKAAKLKAGDLIEVANPIQEENRYLRNSLVPGLLKSISRNPSFDIVEFFEIGNVFSTAGKGTRDAKQIANELLEKFGIEKDVWSVYQIDRDELSRFKIRKPSVSIAEADLTKIFPVVVSSSPVIASEAKQSEISYRPVSSFPSANRDLAFVVDAKTSLLEIRNLILEISPLAVLVEPFDEFKDPRFGKGKKSVAFHIYLQSQDKTLSDKEADDEIEKIVKSLEKKFSAQLRK
jgi:phenylalanyl-tRNA synthetase beta chain